MGPITTRTLGCGATLLVETIPSAASAAVAWLLPVGSATDPPDGDGFSAMLSELIFRGAGGLDSREHSDALDRLGIQRDTTVLSHHIKLGAVLVGSRLAEGLPLLVPMARAPALPESALPAVRSLCLQSLEALDDDPQHLVMLRLRERHRAAPFNRHGYGSREVLERCTIRQLRDAWAQRCVPGGSILAFAGAADARAVAADLDRLLAGWSGSGAPPVETAPPQRGRVHFTQQTAQVHIGMAWDAPPEADPDSVLERIGVGALSGGTSARLFTEVRQKRSLCYSVGASYSAGRETGVVSLYAGTTPQKAGETLDVCRQEVLRLREGISAPEFRRAVVGLKSNLVMQGESTSARASAIAADHFRIGRARTLEELAAAIDEVTPDRLNAYLAGRDFGEFTIATVGPE
jgi:predicted Zn-dependent peptidase